MKKLTIFAALCALVLGSCAENNLDGVTPENNITLPDLTAGFAEDETKTYVHNNTYLRWHEADLITAFYGNSLNRQYKFKGKTGDNSGTFSLIPSGELGTGNDLGAIYAVYPYDENAGINDETRVISLTLPATQTYAENSFGKGANTMIAVTENLEDTFLGFKNACGYLKLKLYGEDVTLASVEVRGNNGEKIAGSATATMEFGGVPALTMSADATTTVTLDCSEGVVLGTSAETATELWIVLPETTFEGGITITATDTEGITFEKSTNNTIAIVRNEIQPMAALNANFISKPASNEIWYTATEKVTPYNANVFGANIVSNEWNETTGEGVITFDGNITSIGEMAFMYSSLSSITIPDSVTSIGYKAFRNCSSLASITIPDSVTSIGYEAFYNCSSLVSITIPDSVTKIGSDAFYNCSSLASVTIGNSVTSIIGYAFQNCSSLTSITIPDSVTKIGSLAFEGCSSLAEFKGKSASEDGRCLIINGVLNSFAPAGLTEYTIPDSVTSIGEHAFFYCSSLASITIPDSVTSIGSDAFSHCLSLTSVTIPDSVTTIGSSAFYNCSSLTSVTIGNGVTSIMGYAFYYCSKLLNIYCKALTPPAIYYGSYSHTFPSNSGMKIYVPRESLAAYKQYSSGQSGSTSVQNWYYYESYLVGYDF